MEIYWAEDIYRLFCGVETLRAAQLARMHPIEWLKCCLNKAWLPIDPLRPFEEYAFAYRHHELETSFRDLSRAVQAGTVLPLTDREIDQLRRG